MNINNKKKYFESKYNSDDSDDSNNSTNSDDLNNSDDQDQQFGYPEENYNSLNTDEFKCKNICPALAKLMGLSIQTENLPVNNWIQPTHSGLSNSEPIIKKNYIQNNNIVNHYNIIKKKIINYDNLDNEDLDFVSKLDSKDNFELIKLFNQTNKDLVNNLLKILKK